MFFAPLTEDGSSPLVHSRTRMSPRLSLVLLAALLAVALLARLPFLRADLTDFDSWRQTDTATIARNFVREPRLLYPRINWGGQGPGYVESEAQLYPYAVSLIYRLARENPVYGRLLSIALSCLTCIVFYRIARRYLEDPVSLLAVALFAFSPTFFRYSRAFMPEATVMLFYLLTLERFLAYLDSGAWASVLQASAAFAIAILVKPTSIHLGLVLMILAAQKSSWRTWFTPKLLSFAAIALIPAGLYSLHGIYLHREYGNTFGTISGGDTKWGGPRWWFSARFYWHLAITDTIGTGGFTMFLALIGAGLAMRGNWRTLVLAWGGTLLAYYLIVARYALIALQYHVFATPLIAMAAAAGAAFLFRSRQGRAIAVVLLCGVLAVDTYLNVHTIRYRDTLLKDAGVALARITQRDDLVVVQSHDPALDHGIPNNYQEPNVFFHADRRGTALPSDQQNVPALKAALACGSKWFVYFPGVSADDAAGFEPYLHSSMDRMAAEPASGPRFEIYKVRDAR